MGVKKGSLSFRLFRFVILLSSSKSVILEGLVFLIYSRNGVEGRVSNRKLVDKAELSNVLPPSLFPKNNNLTNKQSNDEKLIII